MTYHHYLHCLKNVQSHRAQAVAVWFETMDYSNPRADCGEAQQGVQADLPDRLDQRLEAGRTAVHIGSPNWRLEADHTAAHMSNLSRRYNQEPAM